MENKKIEVRPFHESIVGVINDADTMELEILAQILKMTEIPENHDDILTAWTQKIEK